MANAKVTNIGLAAAVATEVAAGAAAGEAPAPTNVDPSDERRVVGTVEYKAPDGSKLVVTNL